MIDDNEIYRIDERVYSNAPKHDKRRSRRNIRTTLLNANPSNFRDIVQKFTGRSSGIDVSNERKGRPVTLDFRSPASVTKQVIFPSSGHIQNQDCAIETHVADDGESKQTASSCEIGQLSDDYDQGNYGGTCDDYVHDNYDNHHNDDLIMREYLENMSSFSGVITMDLEEFYPDAVMVEEFLMRDLDI
ncbi:uncharacterized protein LOC17875738 [Capsella rubella]|uniref:uncharacterized protein LOC17875738 n=1 Tax=Capsella rubella TaxID=81985 RepID=UPI000CD530B4|nr:uncharacterized protein LOC17875738 [Capsella rubella]